MREIKFRVWNKKLRKIVPLSTLGMDKNGVVLDMCFTHEPDENGNDVCDSGYKDNFEIMQYTGLKDKNGKEIYEGDIVTSHNGVIEGVVKYQAPSFIIQLPRRKSWGCFILAPSENQFQEVIGNIYKNSELLVKSNK